MHDFATFDDPINEDDFAGFLDGGDEFLIVQRMDRAQVDDFGIHIVCFEFFRGIQRFEKVGMKLIRARSLPPFLTSGLPIGIS